ncbi:hypothetical protein EBE87_27355 [Pseudoroseomonas wenyumeiae]|uniref:Uncharacterized protein n=1 Tax=Teichococcus wenyumeiae TaxID=2478470 RepID=A0A3A9JA17_9PROT|nr:hypothetical protein [Pseudoroseomonas wenyumeiae]RKK01475.1 hypothetical protein D6Z83_24785 [Pseudoroseomonas wenyumeiae]RMI14738.1 hypothetical protein EBE87_27355 [Pseudoroseomonas wenyumeiae]
MTLFELQAWLGHRLPETTQHYAEITPNTLTKTCTDAGYFARNVPTIEVLIDRQAVLEGTAAAGGPWQHYDLGHGYCSYTFFEQCPHRMACALRLLQHQAERQGAAAGGKIRHRPQAGADPARRWRTRRRRAGPACGE